MRSLRRLFPVGSDSASAAPRLTEYRLTFLRFQRTDRHVQAGRLATGQAYGRLARKGACLSFDGGVCLHLTGRSSKDLTEGFASLPRLILAGLL